MQDNKLIKALVLNAKLGNNSAFQQLYQMTLEQIYALILRLVGDRSSAENLTKKVYVNAWQQISNKDEFMPILIWFKKIGIKTVVDEIGIEKKPSDNQSRNELLDLHPLENAIQKLDFKNKLIFILHDIENFAIEDISKLSGITSKEIKSLLVETRENLIQLTEE